MMDWTDEVQFDYWISNLDPPRMPCLLYVSSNFALISRAIHKRS
jgi:hypothetical protein